MKKSNKYNSALVYLIIAVLLVCSMIPAFAEGGNGDGTGGGKNKPLDLESSSIVNGEQNISLNPEIVLNFNKNVVHFTVKENNKKCFSMMDDNGKNVPIDVIMGDDQVDPSIKRIVTIKPKSSLEPLTGYLLKIGAGITSKSGVSLGKDIYISFTTQDKKDDTSAKTSTIKQTTTSYSATSALQTTAVKRTTSYINTTSKATSETKQTKQIITSRPAPTTTKRQNVNANKTGKTTTAASTAVKSVTQTTIKQNSDGKIERFASTASATKEITSDTETSTTFTENSTTVYSQKYFPKDETNSETESETFSENQAKSISTEYTQSIDMADIYEESSSSKLNKIVFIVPGAAAAVAVPVLIIIKKKK